MKNEELNEEFQLSDGSYSISNIILNIFIKKTWREISEAVLIHCNVVNDSYQQNSIVLYIFVSNKSFGQLLYISPPKNFIFLETFDSEFSYIEVWFNVDLNFNPLEMEDKINITLVIK